MLNAVSIVFTLYSTASYSGGVATPLLLRSLLHVLVTCLLMPAASYLLLFLSLVNQTVPCLVPRLNRVILSPSGGVVTPHALPLSLLSPKKRFVMPRSSHCLPHPTHYCCFTVVPLSLRHLSLLSPLLTHFACRLCVSSSGGVLRSCHRRRHAAVLRCAPLPSSKIPWLQMLARCSRSLFG